jgi:hypothetical protein
MQSEAKRSREWFSLQFAICRVIFRNCRESRSYFLPSFLIVSRPSKEFSRPKEQGAFLALQGKKQGAFFVLQGRSSFGIANAVSTRG